METPLNVWMIMPTASPEKAHRTIKAWHDKGYKVGIQVDSHDFFIAYDIDGREPDLMISCPFDGYWSAANRLVGATKSDADLWVLAADDMEPNEQGAQALADDYYRVFPAGEGLYQPTGDPQGVDANGVPAAARICGSPVFGHGWVGKNHGWGGPMPRSFISFFGDELIKLYAEDRRLLHQNPDMAFMHRHWSWGHDKKTDYQERNQANWKSDKETFARMCKQYGLEPK